MIRYFFLLIFSLFSHLFTIGLMAGDVEYAGIALDCEYECGEEDDLYLDEISSILESTLKMILGRHSVTFLDENMDENFISPWKINNYECKRYIWELKENRFLPKSVEEMSFWTYNEFQSLSNELQKDLNFYYFSLPFQLKDTYRNFLTKLQSGYEEGYRCYEVYDGMIIFSYRLFGQCSKDDLGHRMSRIKNAIESLDEISLENKYQKSQALLANAIEKIEDLYRQMFITCLENHQEEGIQFNSAIESLIIKDYEGAFNAISLLIDFSENNEYGSDFISKLYLLKGQVQSEFCQYADAILALTTSISKNPHLKEAYFERASAYFELGEFDKAIEDYLESGMRSLSFMKNNGWGLSIHFSSGMIEGIVRGGGESLADFLPETLSSMRGLSRGLWAFVSHPVDSSLAFANAAVECVNYIKNTTPLELVQDMVPELRQLVQNMDHLTDFEKGSLVGKIIGKYGVEILACKYSAKAVKAYTELKKANNALTLESLVSPATHQKILEESGKRWAHRESTLKNGKLQIQWGRQGKHIIGDNSYNLIANRSIWMYPKEKTQKLISDYAGSGIRSHRSTTHIPGMPGYQEIVDFGEFIGYHVHPDTGVKTATTFGKIHYANEGLHVVPYLKKGN